MKNPLKQNVGPLDRFFRVCVGVALVTLGILVAEGTTGAILTIVSIPILFSGIMGFCPTYMLFGGSTTSPRGRTVPQMQRVCCATEQGSPCCAPMMNDAGERMYDRSCCGVRRANAASEGGER